MKLQRVLFLLIIVAGPHLSSAQEFNEIVYLAADWVPAMKLSSKEGEEPKFNDTEEEVYFLKQVTHFRRDTLAQPDLSTGNKTRAGWTERGLYLCKMKPDGSDKTEIKELWRDMAYPIDTQTQSTWLDVNEKTRTIVVSVTYAGTDIMGLWTMNLDGTALKRILPVRETDFLKQRINKPSWSVNGQSIVFEEQAFVDREERHRIMKCDANGGNVVALTEGPKDAQPSVSPDGKQVLYIHWIGWASRLYLINIDGTDQHPLPNPDDRRWGTHGGTWPGWSPDGKKIHYFGAACIVADVKTGKATAIEQEKCGGWRHWGKQGFIGHTVGGVLVTKLEAKDAIWLGINGRQQCQPDNKEKCRW